MRTLATQEMIKVCFTDNTSKAPYQNQIVCGSELLYTEWILLAFSMNDDKTSTIMSNECVLQVSLIVKPHLVSI